MSGPELAVRVRGLSNSFGQQVVHKDLDLDVRTGEIIGVVGGSGTGKSVLMRAVLGLRRPQAGKIDVLGVGGRRVRGIASASRTGDDTLRGRALPVIGIEAW